MRIGNILQFILVRRKLKKASRKLPFTSWQMYLSQDTNVGKGRGKVKSHRTILNPQNRFKYFLDKPKLFKERFRMTLEQFEIIFIEMKESFGDQYLKKRPEQKALSLKNRILLFFEWIFHYEPYHTLSTMYNTSSSIISHTINDLMPFMVNFFVHFIDPVPNSSNHSVLSKHILFVIDGTYHPTQKPSSLQHLFYSGKSCCHCIQTQILIDYDGYIKCAETGSICLLFFCSSLLHHFFEW